MRIARRARRQAGQPSDPKPFQLMNCLLLFASQPLNGQVLPQLVPPLHPFQAALLYHAMLRDQLRILAEIPDSKARICFEQGLLPGSFEGDLQWELQRGETREER